MTMMKLFLPVVELEPEKLNELFSEIVAIDEYPQGREQVLYLLLPLVTQQIKGSHQEKIEHLLSFELGESIIIELLEEWVNENPQEALEWFQEKEAANQLASKGAYNHAILYFNTVLIGLYRSSPEQAEQLYFDAPIEYRLSSFSVIAQPVFERLHETGNTNELEELLAREPEQKIRSRLVEGAARRAKTLPEIMALLSLQDDSSAFSGSLTNSIVNQSWPLEEKVTALREHLSEEDYERGIGKIFQAGDLLQDEAVTWLLAQSESPARDDWYSTYVRNLYAARAFERAQELADKISNPQLRTNNLVAISKAWFRQNPSEAEKATAPDILEKLNR